MNPAKEEIVVGGVYQHFKGEDRLYRVIRIARDCDDPLKEMVIYEQLYETKEFPKGTLWVRSLEEFLGEKYDLEKGLIKRFNFVSLE